MYDLKASLRKIMQGYNECHVVKQFLGPRIIIYGDLNRVEQVGPPHGAVFTGNTGGGNYPNQQVWRAESEEQQVLALGECKHGPLISTCMARLYWL